MLGSGGTLPDLSVGSPESGGTKPLVRFFSASPPYAPPLLQATATQPSSIQAPAISFFSHDKLKKYQQKASKELHHFLGPVSEAVEPQDAFVYYKPIPAGVEVIFNIIQDGDGPRERWIGICSFDVQEAVPVWVTPLANRRNPSDKLVKIELLRPKSVRNLDESLLMGEIKWEHTDETVAILGDTQAQGRRTKGGSSKTNGGSKPDGKRTPVRSSKDSSTQDRDGGGKKRRGGQVVLKAVLFSVDSIWPKDVEVSIPNSPRSAVLECNNASVSLHVGQPIALPRFLNKAWDVRVIIVSVIQLKRGEPNSQLIVRQLYPSDGVITEPPQYAFPLMVSLNRFQYETLKVAAAQKEPCSLRSLLDADKIGLSLQQRNSSTAIELYCPSLVIHGHDTQRYSDLLKNAPETLSRWIEGDVTSAMGLVSNAEQVRQALQNNMDPRFLHPAIYLPLAVGSFSASTLFKLAKASANRAKAFKQLIQKASGDVGRNVTARFLMLVDRTNESFDRVEDLQLAFVGQ